MVEIAFGFVGTIFAKVTRFRMIELARRIAAFRIKFTFHRRIDGSSNRFVVHNRNNMRSYKRQTFRDQPNSSTEIGIAENLHSGGAALITAV